MRTRIILTLLAAIVAVLPAMGQKRQPSRFDSIQHVDEVVVTSKIWSREIIPSQKLSGEALQRLSAHSIADALRYFAGVQLKDYGGIGGLKTVNVRSLGTNHTGVFYDGIELGNAQNGVVDLGRFSLDNMESVQLYNGQKSSVFQSAKDYGSASAVYMQSRVPDFTDGRRDHLKVAMKAGSFDTYNPSLLWEHRLGRGTSSQLSAEWMKTSGRYKFRYAKKNGYDTTEVRRNGDVEALRLEGALFGKSDRSEWKSKLYFYHSERGFPGAAVREEPGKFRHQDRQWDTNVFAQASLRRRVTDAYSLLLQGKAAFDHLHYLSDPRLDVTTMFTDNTYRQTEAYLSVAQLFSVNKWWNVSLSNDVQFNYLDANLTQFVYPSRWLVLTALASSAEWGQVNVQASLLHTFSTDHTGRSGGTNGCHSRLTPTVALSWNALEGRDQLSLRSFFKRIFRLPTFNDLYYTFIGTKTLEPETTTQYDVGAVWSRQWLGRSWLRQTVLTADAYYNTVDNKIVAMPTSNQFRWTMMNFGRCHILGLDVSAKADWLVGQVQLSTHATYTYTRAKDMTEPESEFYGGQLPYIPWHSGSAIVSATWRQWTVNYSFIYTGERYESSANIPENYSKPWYTNDLSLTRQLSLKPFRLLLTLEANNIFNQQYEVVQCYPMPGTNFKVKATFIL